MKKLILIFVFIFLLNSVYAVCEEGQIDINSADKGELQEIVNIGEVISGRVIENRPFESVDELIDVKGIGEITLGEIKEENLACVDESESKENEKEKISNDLEKDSDDEIKKTFIPANKNADAKDVELEEITLNPKNIKSDDNSDKNYAWYGLIAFSILLGFLFSFKVMKDKDISILRFRKYKNEFIE